MSESNKCSMYTNAIIANTTKSETNAGICPKSDPNVDWIQKYHYSVLSTAHIPDKQYFWCCGNGTYSASICTFPFWYNSELYYEPTDGKCGSNVSQYEPVTYSSSFSLWPSYLCQRNISLHKEHSLILNYKRRYPLVPLCVPPCEICLSVCDKFVICVSTALAGGI